jgi:hypothetical protein
VQDNTGALNRYTGGSLRIEAGEPKEAIQWSLPSSRTIVLDCGAHWLKVKNPKAPAVKREAEQDWGR